MLDGVSTWLPIALSNAYDADAAGLFARMTTQPNAARKNLINSCILSLKSAGVWDKLDALWLLAAADAQSAGLNWKSSSFTISPVNSPTFTVDRGYLTDGTASYLDTNFNPATQGVNFTQGNASMHVWSRTGGQTTSSFCGWYTGAAGSVIQPRNSTDGFVSNINTNNQFLSAANTNGVGMFSISRQSASLQNSYINGNSGASNAHSSVAVPSNNLYVGRSTASGYAAREAAMFAAGAGLSGPEMAAFYSAINTYLTGVGAA